MAGTELRKLTSYVLIGLGTTALTWVLWTLGDSVLRRGLDVSASTSLAVSQFAASFLVIGVSLYLNRKITFKDHARRHRSKWTTAAHYYAVYTLGSLVASGCTYLLSRHVEGLPLEVIKLTGLGVNVAINYLGQRLWIFR